MPVKNVGIHSFKDRFEYSTESTQHYRYKIKAAILAAYIKTMEPRILTLEHWNAGAWKYSDKNNARSIWLILELP